MSLDVAGVYSYYLTDWDYTKTPIVVEFELVRVITAPSYAKTVNGKLIPIFAPMPNFEEEPNGNILIYVGF